MKALDLYQNIKKYFPLIPEGNICTLSVNKTQKNKGILKCDKCTTSPKTLLIDFDEVKELYCKTHKKSSLSSSDGVKNSINKANVFYFIEIKSIQEVFANPKSDVNRGKMTIEQKTIEYGNKSKKKIRDSIKICREIVKDENLFNSNDIHPAFVFVTDMATENVPLDDIVLKLNLLSFDTHIRKELLDIKNSNTISVYYTYCHKFDTEYNSDFTASLI